MKAGKDLKTLSKSKFKLYYRYLNVLLLKTGDPYVAKMYDKYLKFKKLGKYGKKDKNFYERMNVDV